MNATMLPQGSYRTVCWWLDIASGKITTMPKRRAASIRQ